MTFPCWWQGNDTHWMVDVKLFFCCHIFDDDPLWASKFGLETTSHGFFCVRDVDINVVSSPAVSSIIVWSLDVYQQSTKKAKLNEETMSMTCSDSICLEPNRGKRLQWSTSFLEHVNKVSRKVLKHVASQQVKPSTPPCHWPMSSPVNTNMR